MPPLSARSKNGAGGVNGGNGGRCPPTNASQNRAVARERSWSNGPGPNRIQMPSIQEGQPHFIKINGGTGISLHNNNGYRGD